MDWFVGENLNRKPSIFPWKSWRFPVSIFPQNPLIPRSWWRSPIPCWRCWTAAGSIPTRPAENPWPCRVSCCRSQPSIAWRMGTSGVVFWRVERCWEMLKYMIFQVKPMSRLDKLPRRVDARLNFSACGWFPPIQTVQGVGLEMFPTWLVSDQQKPLPIKHGNWKSPIRIYKVLVGKASL